MPKTVQVGEFICGFTDRRRKVATIEFASSVSPYVILVTALHRYLHLVECTLWSTFGRKEGVFGEEKTTSPAAAEREGRGSDGTFISESAVGGWCHFHLQTRHDARKRRGTDGAGGSGTFHTISTSPQMTFSFQPFWSVSPKE